MRDESRHPDQVDRSFPDRLEGDLDVAAPGVPRLGHGGSLRARSRARQGRGGFAAAPTAEPWVVPYITSNVSKTMTWAPPRRTGQVSANFAAWSSESAWITE